MCIDTSTGLPFSCSLASFFIYGPQSLSCTRVFLASHLSLYSVSMLLFPLGSSSKSSQSPLKCKLESALTHKIKSRFARCSNRNSISNPLSLILRYSFPHISDCPQLLPLESGNLHLFGGFDLRHCTTPAFCIMRVALPVGIYMDLDNGEHSRGMCWVCPVRLLGSCLRRLHLHQSHSGFPEASHT